MKLQIDQTLVSYQEIGEGRPLLAIHGLSTDHIVGYQSAFDLLGRYPRATFAILDAAGHFLGGIERVGLSRVLISDWIDRIEAYTASAGHQ